MVLGCCQQIQAGLTSKDVHRGMVEDSKEEEEQRPLDGDDKVVERVSCLFSAVPFGQCLLNATCRERRSFYVPRHELMTWDVTGVSESYS